MLAPGKSTLKGIDTQLVERAAPLLPAKSQFVDVAGYSMHYIEDGSGPTVLLVHGNPTWCFFYRELFKKLRETHRVIAVDQLGCGLSSNPTKEAFRAIDRAAHLEEFVQKLGIEKLSLVMHDWGGSIGTLFASKKPERIEKLVYFNTTLTETESLPFVIRRAARGAIGRFLTQGSKRFLKLTTSVGVAGSLPREIRKAYELPYATRARRKAIWEFVQDIPFNDSHPTHHEMRTLAGALPTLAEKPVQIIWGLKDICFHRGMLSKISRQFPHAELHEIPEASHLVLEDAPELVGRRVSSFLNRDEGPDRRTERVVASAFTEPNPLFEAFEKRAEERPQDLAISEVLFLGDSPKYSQLNYGKLLTRVNQYRRGLRELGLVPGDRVLMLVSPGIEFLSLAYAVMGEGAVPCFVDPGMGLKKLKTCIAELQPSSFIGSPKAQVLRLIPGQIPSGMKFTLTAAEWFFLGGKNLSFLKRFADRPDEAFPNAGTGLIAFTSGATGVPKGVVFSNEMLRAQMKIFSEEFKLLPGKRDLPLLPVFSLYHLALGVASVFAPLDPSKPLELDPDRIIRILEDKKVTTSFGSPALWNKICDYAERTSKSMPTLERVFMAGAPVPVELIERMRRVTSPGCEVFTPYGATEALPVTLVSGEELLNQKGAQAKGGELGQFVGKAVPGVSLCIGKVIEEQNVPQGFEALDPYEIGEVLVSGENVSSLYFERQVATRSSKFRDSEAKLWHRMGDLGYFDEDDNLYFCGRKVHAITNRKGSWYSVPTERIFNSLEEVRRAALIELDEQGTPAIVIEPNARFWPASAGEREDFTRKLRAVGEQSEITKSIKHFFFFKDFPVDPRHNAKIYRHELQAWAVQQYSVGKVA